MKGNEMKAHPAMAQILTTQFRRAAMVYHWGREQEDRKMQSAGEKSAAEAIKGLDIWDEGRASLVPLLDDPDPSVRVFAAGYLVKVMPDRPLPVLQELDERGTTVAHMTAFWFLQRHKSGEDL